MSNSRMQQLADFGQSVWLDYISRPLLETGELKNYIEQGLRGMTSNPSIFNNAIGSSTDYDEKITKLKAEGKSIFEIYDELTIADIQEATDQFRGVYDQTNGLDGYVSLEINPLLANHVDEQIKEGVRLFQKVNRPNCMIKVPSTKEGFSVVEELISQGINVNVTLIFSLKQYEQTAQAYINGVKKLLASGGDVSKVRSVASVFISRIDTAVDKQLEELVATESDPKKKEILSSLQGKAAVANSRIIFEKAQEIFSPPDFKTLASQGAHLQRVLWGSTSTKNPEYSDIKYVTELIASPTVNTIPEKTLKAFIDHGEVEGAFTRDVKEDEQVIASLNQVGINIDDVCLQLLTDGCEAFNQAFQELTASLEAKAAQLAKA